MDITRNLRMTAPMKGESSKEFQLAEIERWGQGRLRPCLSQVFGGTAWRDIQSYEANLDVECIVAPERKV